MVNFGSWKGQSLTFNAKPNCLTISLSSKTASTVYSFDAEGRLWTAMQAGISYRRGLNGRVVAKWQLTGGGRQRRWLTPAEADELTGSARLLAAELLSAARKNQLDLSPALLPADMSMLESASGYTQISYRRDLAQYISVYRPVGILPPDQYMAVVLQVTEGCSFNTCTFCTFYRDRRFHIKTDAELEQHLSDVRGYLAHGLSLRRTIFLGDANALVTPMPRLIAMLDQINAAFDVEALGGIYAFLDGFSGERKSSEDYARLAERGLKRIYIGLESGSDELLQFLHKPGKSEDAVQAVKAIKAGGVDVGVIILLGAGGHQYARRHVDETIRVLNAMPLDLDDLIYFSELIESEDMPYVRDAYDGHLQPLTEKERLDQQELIESALVFPAEAGIPHISRYDIREFVY